MLWDCFCINSSLADGNISFSVGEDGAPYATYKVGADTVTKKLGNNDLIYACAKTRSKITISKQTDKFYIATATGGKGCYINDAFVDATNYMYPDIAYGGFHFIFAYYEHSLDVGDTVSVWSPSSLNNNNEPCGGFAIIY